MMNSPTSPFICRFRTERNRYVYDVNTNDFFQVDNITYELLGAWGRDTTANIFSRAQRQYSREDLLEAFAEIERYRNQGFFSDFRPERLEFPLTRDDFKEQLRGKMQHLILNVTENCNLRCSYCVYSGKHPFQRSHSNVNMSFVIARKAVDFFLAHSQETDGPCVSFYGGEPLLNIALIRQVIAYIKQEQPKRDIHLQMTTNGTLLRRDILDYLVSKRIVLIVSLDGPKEIHDSGRVDVGGQGSFETIIQNLKDIKKKYPEYYNRDIGFVCTLDPTHNIESIQKFFQSNEALFANNRIIVKWIVPATNTSRNTESHGRISGMKNLLMLFEKSLLAGTIPDKFLRSLFERTLLTIHRRCPNRLESKHYPNGICEPGIRRLFCSSAGQFTLCERVTPTLVIGDVFNGLDQEKAYNITQEYSNMSTPDCTNCWAIRMCQLCFCQLQDNHFNIEKKRAACTEMRRSILNMISLYWSILERNEHAFDYTKDIVLR